MRLKNKRVAVLVEDNFEDLEFWVPVMRLQEEGALVSIVGLEAGKVYKAKGCLTAKSDVATSTVKAADFVAVVVPGGWAPDKLRRYEAVKSLVRGVHDQGGIVGLICHAGWVGISAGIVRKGGKAVGSVGIKDDIENVGGVWVDEPAFRDGNIVWGRVVADIPKFCYELVRAIESVS